MNLAVLAPLYGDDLCRLIRFVQFGQQTGFKISALFMMNDVNPAQDRCGFLVTKRLREMSDTYL